MHILLIEDDEDLGEGLEQALNWEGYQVKRVKDGFAAEDILVNKKENFDAIILDCGLPGMDGTEVIKIIRDKGIDTPIIIITTRALEKIEGIGFDNGADGYFEKPFNFDELCYHLNHLIISTKKRERVLLKHGDIALDPEAYTATKAGKEVVLYRREFYLLKLFMESQGRTLTREILEHNTYAYGEGVESNAIEVHIHMLRKKFGTDIIQTIRGMGWLMPKLKETVDTHS